MGRRRGFFAEIQHQNKLEAQRKRREHDAAVRAHNQAIRRAEQARKKAQRAKAAAERAREQERKRAEREARESHKQERTAEAEAIMAGYAEAYDQIDSLLIATLDVDDYVDLETLKVEVSHPDFDPGGAGKPNPRPAQLHMPPEPVFTAPPPPTGVSAWFGGRAKYEERLRELHKQWKVAHIAWMHEVNVAIPNENKRRFSEHAKKERVRERKLLELKIAYEQDCKRRENEAAQRNEAVDDLINRLSRGEAAAVDEYVGIVLANSVYPSSYPVDHDFRYDEELRELSVVVTVPEPESLPSVKVVRYVATADEIRETVLSKADQKRRYNDAVHAVALRTMHEIFEADRVPWIDTISLSVRTVAVDPATGHDAEYVFVLAAAARETFAELNLRGVEPMAALIGLRAELAKNPFNLDSVGESGFEVRR